MDIATARLILALAQLALALAMVWVVYRHTR